MRIVVAHGSNDLYGASRVLIDDVSILRELAHEVCVLLPEDGPLTPLLEDAGADVEICRLAVLRRVAVTRARVPVRLPRQMAGADLVVLWTLALASYLPALRLRGKPVVCSVHEIQPGAAGRALAATAQLLADGVMANSHATAKWLRPGSQEHEQIVAYPPAPLYDPLPLPADDRPFQVLVAGRVNGDKGHLEAVEACEMARTAGTEVHLVLLGAPFPGQEEHLRRLLRAIDGLPWAAYRGEVAAIRPHLREAEALLVPSVKPESFGIVALEGWAAGRRVLAAEAGGLAEIADMIGAARFPPGDVEAMAEALVAAVARRGELPPLQPSTVEDICSIERRGKAWDALLASILPAGQASPRATRRDSASTKPNRSL